MIADRVGGIRTLLAMYSIAAVLLFVMSFGQPTYQLALAIIIPVMAVLGMGNGAVFQLVPQRFRKEIGVMTGLVGMAGGVGGFYLAASLGYFKQSSGTYQTGLLIFAGLAVLAMIGLAGVKNRWRTTWGTATSAKV
jgi:NNP family nitrate/nitrite transporter-like MFS transporter